MLLTFNTKKWMWTNEPWTTSWWFIFDYENISIINNMKDVFSIIIDWETYNATINTSTQNPIVIDTNTWVHRFKQWEASEDFNDVVESMIKLDIFLPDAISWLLRIESITFDN